jgi:FKBP-type peptidyl-prolyl cis-trans isomerase FkpA/FKBP-type peptidyl-prolyl cis-trans isomerase FklB
MFNHFNHKTPSVLVENHNMLKRTFTLSFVCSLMFGCASSNNTGHGYSAEKINANWLRINLKRDGVVATDSGLQYKIIKKTDGCTPDQDSEFTVHYKMLSPKSKKLIDSSYLRGHPIDFPLSKMIKGWREGVPMMKVGETWEFYIPAYLAYGSKGRPGVIAPDTLLVSEVTLIDARCQK